MWAWAGAASLVGVMAFAAIHESRSRPAPTMSAASSPSAAAPVRQALTPEEERYAGALWGIHTQVKADAVKITFAGLAYKMGDIDKSKVRERVAPLTQAYDGALAKASAIEPPANLAGMHKQYLEAIRSYRDATVEMVKVADDGNDSHLLAAQQMTEGAARTLLQASDALWPGEYKPN
jgi:hypothetical protein